MHTVPVVQFTKTNARRESQRKNTVTHVTVVCFTSTACHYNSLHVTYLDLFTVRNSCVETGRDRLPGLNFIFFCCSVNRANYTEPYAVNSIKQASLPPGSVTALSCALTASLPPSTTSTTTSTPTLLLSLSSDRFGYLVLQFNVSSLNGNTLPREA